MKTIMHASLIFYRLIDQSTESIFFSFCFSVASSLNESLDE